MKKTQGYITIMGNTRGQLEYKLVSGYVANVGYGIEAFVHRDGISPERWVVSERRSGMAISTCVGGTREAAIEEAISMLKNKVKKQSDLQNLISSQVEHYGIKIPELV